jgi:hypothetical protein
MKKNKLIPFHLLPASWGLSGKTRKMAEAEYYFDGYDLDIALVNIHHDGYDAHVAKLGVDLKYGKITQYEHDIKLSEVKTSKDEDTALATMADIISDEKLTDEVANKKIDEIKAAYEDKKLINKLDVDLLHGKISKIDYDKKLAEITGAPWVSIPKINWDPTNNKQTYFELDYNPAFVEDLRENGYSGTEEEVIDQWLNDVCGSIANEMNDELVNNTFVSVNRKKRNGGLTEHS